MIEKLHTLKEASLILSLGKTTLFAEIKSGRLKATYVGKRRVRFTPESIKEYIHKCNSVPQKSTNS